MSVLHEQERRFVFCESHDDILKLYRKTVLMDMRKRLQSLGTFVRDEIDKMALKIFSTDSVEQVLDMRYVCIQVYVNMLVSFTEINITIEETKYKNKKELIICREHIHKLAANVAHAYAFGRTYDLDDPKLKCWMSALAQYRELLHWFRYENFLPLNQLFAADFHTKAKQFRENTLPLYTVNIERAKLSKSTHSDEDDNGLLGTLLDMLEGDGLPKILTDSDIISVLRDVMFGGSDGAFQPLIWILMYVAKDMKIQEEIYSEICSVIGPSRMPELSDRESMPYVEATIREVLRHSEITSLGIPRSTVKDVTIFGHKIPKDTLTIVNVYSIHRDECHWQEPFKFRPSRFLDNDNELLPTSKLSYLPFSAGQRSCVGQNVARANLFLLFVRFFQKFRVSPADEEIPEKINSGGSFNPDLKPFKITLKSRKI